MDREDLKALAKGFPVEEVLEAKKRAAQTMRSVFGKSWRKDDSIQDDYRMCVAENLRSQINLTKTSPSVKRS